MLGILEKNLNIYWDCKRRWYCSIFFKQTSHNTWRKGKYHIQWHQYKRIMSNCQWQGKNDYGNGTRAKLLIWIQCLANNIRYCFANNVWIDIVICINYRQCICSQKMLLYFYYLFMFCFNYGSSYCVLQVIPKN